MCSIIRHAALLRIEGFIIHIIFRIICIINLRLYENLKSLHGNYNMSYRKSFWKLFIESSEVAPQKQQLSISRIIEMEQ